jgi:hypothetical protein
MNITKDLPAMVEEVMRHVVADVTKYSTAVHRGGSIPVVREDGVSESIEWRCEDYEQRWRHDKTVSIHRKIVVNSVEKEVQADPDTVIGEITIRY